MSLIGFGLNLFLGRPNSFLSLDWQSALRGGCLKFSTCSFQFNLGWPCTNTFTYRTPNYCRTSSFFVLSHWVFPAYWPQEPHHCSLQCARDSGDISLPYKLPISYPIKLQQGFLPRFISQSTLDSSIQLIGSLYFFYLHLSLPRGTHIKIWFHVLSWKPEVDHLLGKMGQKIKKYTPHWKSLFFIMYNEML